MSDTTMVVSLLMWLGFGHGRKLSDDGCARMLSTQRTILKWWLFPNLCHGHYLTPKLSRKAADEKALTWTRLFRFKPDFFPPPIPAHKSQAQMWLVPFIFNSISETITRAHKSHVKVWRVDDQKRRRCKNKMEGWLWDSKLLCALIISLAFINL